jgi:phosphoglycerate dehydrogenase-like enzyme
LQNSNTKNVTKNIEDARMDAFTLAVIDNMFLAREFADIAERAERSGMRVLRYAGNEPFLAATAEHGEIDAVFCMGGTRCDAALLARMKRLKALLSAITGIEGFDTEAATAHGIVVGNGQTELNYVGMAEATVLLILTALYDFNGTQNVLRNNLPRPSPLKARLLRGKTIGFVGFGHIAQEVAHRLGPWGVTMIAYVHRPNPKLAELGVAEVALEALLRGADIVSLHCSLNPATHHILNRERLGLLRPEAILINAARGALVDEQELAEALAQGRIAGAALDTFVVEPLPLDSPLRTLPNVILTPHMVGHTIESNDSLRDAGWESIRRVAAGLPPLFVKNPEVMTRWRATSPLEGAA